MTDPLPISDAAARAGVPGHLAPVGKAPAHADGDDAAKPAPGAGTPAKMGMGAKIGVGAAIGSAAIAAALLYVNHGRER